MIRRLESLADRGCWISDDRVYAFVTADAGIGEVGYHGTQIVSRNSRILYRAEGVIRVAWRSPEGVEQGLRWSSVDWEPGRVIGACMLPRGSFTITFQASGKTIHIRVQSRKAPEGDIIVRMRRDACFDDVRGERTWSAPLTTGDSLVLECRDAMRLIPWLAGSGPYAGDFLIPEPWRKRIFSRAIRSGLATRDDLKPEFRDADILLYDATVILRLGGEGFRLSEEGEEWIFAHPCRPGGLLDARYVVECGDAEWQVSDPEESPGPSRGAVPLTAPGLSVVDAPAWAEFFGSVPSLVDSCRVRDIGVPRACPGRYYWLWAWDMLATVSEAFRWGDAGLAASTLRFVDAHRDANGVIPAQWTRSLEPLDTPSPGGIEYLFCALAYEHFLETADLAMLREVYPSLRRGLLNASHSILTDGCVHGEGFYPDLLRTFGRAGTSAVAMETGCWYAYSRLMQNLASVMADDETRQRAGECAAAIHRTFESRFWDPDRGFYRDAVSPDTGQESPFHPLFALLFLHSSLGLSLLRPHIRDAADFVAARLLTEHGMRTLPLEEVRGGQEVIFDAWYPHWDLYALMLLRRAGNGGAIMQWFRRAEVALTRLGYCPEFLDLRGFREGAQDAWTRHGSASNLNCVTGWYRAAREALAGIVIDPGGLTHIPLSLPVEFVTLRDVHWRGGIWRIDVVYDGPNFESMKADGAPVEGCTKIPAGSAGSGVHRLMIRYGQKAPHPMFIELVNAEVTASSARGGEVLVECNGLGFVDATFYSHERPQVAIDGNPVESFWDEATGSGWFRATLLGRHSLRLFPAGD